MSQGRSSANRLLDIIEYLVDERVGIIHNVEEAHREAGAPALFYFFANACDTSAFGQQRNFGETGGASLDRRGAMAKAVGEAIERYCSAIFQADDLPVSSYDSAPFQCIPPCQFVLNSSEQYARPEFPFVPFHTGTRVCWTPTTEALTGQTWYVPAAMVYVPYFYNALRGESPIVQSISTGLACHMSHPEAAASAICEVIERDAFTITWQAMLPRTQVKAESLSDRNRELVARIERTGNKVTIFDITMDVGIPTILSVISSQAPESPARVFAASASADPEQAVRKSLEEVAYTRLLAQHLKTTLSPIIPQDDYGNIVDQDSHVHFYADHRNTGLADFIFQSRRTIDFHDIVSLTTGDPEGDLAVLIDKVHSIGHRVLLADLTTPDVSPLGLFVVRAVIPGFHPLFLCHNIRALGGSRLWEVPQKLGYAGRTRETGDNPAPHPYP